MNLVEEIEKALDEDERIARASLRNPSRYDHTIGDHVDIGVDDGEWTADRCAVEPGNPPVGDVFVGGIHIYDEGGHTEEQAQHIARQDPKRILRQAAARRRMLARHQPERRRISVEDDTGWTVSGWYVCWWCTPNSKIYAGQRNLIEWPCPDIIDLAEAYEIEVQCWNGTENITGTSDGPINVSIEEKS